MRQREAGKHEFDERTPILAFSGLSVFRSGHFRSIWISWAATDERPYQVHSVVIFVVSAGRNRHRMGDVPILSLTLCAMFQVPLSYGTTPE